MASTVAELEHGLSIIGILISSLRLRLCPSSGNSQAGADDPVELAEIKEKCDEMVAKVCELKALMEGTARGAAVGANSNAKLAKMLGTGAPLDFNHTPVVPKGRGGGSGGQQRGPVGRFFRRFVVQCGYRNGGARPSK